MIAVVDNKAYTPYGGARELWSCKKEKILFDGPAGTGKSRAILEKINRIARKVPGVRILLVRKTRVSLTETLLVTFENHVLTENDPIKSGPCRASRSKYTYPNGSEIVLGGMDKPEKILSSDYDLIVVGEATECTQNDFETLDTRLRHGVLGYQQIVCDTNPSFPGHWLKKMSDEGKIHRIMSRHKDNPTVTPEYLKRLNNLSGSRRSRLFKGQWAAAEGLVYDKWDTALFVMKRKEFISSRKYKENMKKNGNSEKQRWYRTIIGVDEGYTNPCSMHVYGIDNDGRMHVLREWYQREKLESEVVDQAMEFQKEWNVEAVIVDPSAAKLRAALAIKGLPVRESNNDVFGGIQACQERLVIGKDMLPRITIDPSCKYFIEEIESYVWSEQRDGSLKDQPKKTNDHAMDEWRYVNLHVKETSGSMKVLVL